MPTNFEVNGKPVSVDVEPRMTLADCLRHDLRLTGTHVGCEHGVCGACTVLVDGEAVRSCLMLAVQAEGTKVVTVEGLSNDEALTPLQASFRKHHALQCGFCTPGMITTAHALLERGAGLRRRPRARGAVRQPLPLHRLYLDRRGGARRARGLQEADGRHEEHLHRQRRSSAARICASCAAAANIVDDLAAGRAALCGDPAQLGRARAHRLDRHRGGAEDPGRACGHHRQGHAGRRRRSCRCGCSRCPSSSRSSSR